MSRQSEESPALDQLYEALTEVQSHLHEHAQERESILAAVEKMEKQLNDQRSVAARAGERDTYKRLSKDLTMLARAYRVASEDPDADPLDEYQWTDEEPKDQPQEAENETGDAEPGDSGAAGSSAKAAAEAGPGDSAGSAPGQADNRGGGSESEPGVDESVGDRVD